MGVTKLSIIILFVLAIVAGGYYISNNTSPTSENNEITIIDDSEMNVFEDSGDEMVIDTRSGARYVEYSSGVLEESVDSRRVLFFYASWCPTCRPADRSFSDNEAEIPGDVTVIRVNYNDPETDANERALAEEYGVTYQHTFVQIDSEGNEVTKWNGGQIEELLQNIK